MKQLILLYYTYEINNYLYTDINSNQNIINAINSFINCSKSLTHDKYLHWCMAIVSFKQFVMQSDMYI